ncbi:MAG TPA: hypothetical protein VMH80_02725 [Bryobacteraceae bacterium]|nr:hypothetical protein [Bryobacteraceae bacterium]
MDPTTRAVLGVCMRWIHIASVVTLIGGFIYARLVLAPALASLTGPDRDAFRKRTIAGFRPFLYTLMIFILGSGAYNYVTKGSYPPHYHMWMGIKLLLVLHIFAAGTLYAARDADEAKTNRTLTGIVISGLIVIAIASYLRWISLT